MLKAQATVLLVENIRRSADYYSERLGFDVSRYDADPDHYGSAERDECYVHLAHFHDASPRPNSQAVPPDMFDAYFWVDDVDALHSELADRGASVIQAPVEQDYGLRDFRVQDPDGYVLAFGKQLA